jgi:hypothetical protein
MMSCFLDVAAEEKSVEKTVSDPLGRPGRSRQVCLVVGVRKEEVTEDALIDVCCPWHRSH